MFAAGAARGWVQFLHLVTAVTVQCPAGTAGRRNCVVSRQPGATACQRGVPKSLDLTCSLWSEFKFHNHLGLRTNRILPRLALWAGIRVPTAKSSESGTHRSRTRQAPPRPGDRRGRGLREAGGSQSRISGMGCDCEGVDRDPMAMDESEYDYVAQPGPLALTSV